MDILQKNINQQEEKELDLVERLLNIGREEKDGKIVLFPTISGSRYDAEQYEPIDGKMVCTRLLELKKVEKSEKDFGGTTVIDESKIVDLHNLSVERNLPIFVVFLFVSDSAYYLYNISEIEEFPIVEIKTKRVQFSTISDKVKKNVYRVQLKKENRFEIK